MAVSLAASTAFTSFAGATKPPAVTPQVASASKKPAEKKEGNEGKLNSAVANGRLAIMGATVGLLGGACSRGRNNNPRMRVMATANASLSTPFDPTEARGVLAPVGYWDPAGLMKEAVGEINEVTGIPAGGYQFKSKEAFEEYRIMELKHGRLAMLAVTGMLTTIFVKFPGAEFEYSPVGFNVFDSEAASGIGIIFIIAGGIELMTPKGDFNNPLADTLGLDKSFSDNAFLQEAELAHGRLGMSAALTFFLYNYFLGNNGFPSDVVKIGANPSNPVAVGVAALLLLAWTNAKTWDNLPEGKFVLGSKVIYDSAQNINLIEKTGVTAPKLESVEIKAKLPESLSESASKSVSAESKAESVSESVSAESNA